MVHLAQGSSLSYLLEKQIYKEWKRSTVPYTSSKDWMEKLIHELHDNSITVSIFSTLSTFGWSNIQSEQSMSV